MKKILLAVLALLVLASCTPLCMSSEQHRAEARAVTGDIVRGTVRSVLAAPEPEEPWEHTHLSYEDPLDEADAIAVTVEPEGGSPQPTTDPMLIGKL